MWDREELDLRRDALGSRCPSTLRSTRSLSRSRSVGRLFMKAMNLAAAELRGALLREAKPKRR